MSLLLESTIKISLVVLAVLVATTLLRKHSAALRHWVLSISLICAAATPFLELVIPSWQVHLGAVPSATTDMQEKAHVAASGATQKELPVGQIEVSTSFQEQSSDPARMFSVRYLLAAIWIAGFVTSAFILLVGFARLAWLASRSTRLLDRKWTDPTRDIARDYRLRRPVLLLQSDHPTLLVTWGLLRPKVILPAAAREWPEDRIRVVLSHELAHIRRLDWVVQVGAEFLRSVYWFNPLLWIFCGRLRQESEHACDDAVLNRGVEGPEYAAHLLDLARAFNKPRRNWFPAPAIVRPSSLERRISSMLNTCLNRNPLTRKARMASLIGLLILTGAIASAQTSATLSGFISDQTGGRVTDGALVLSHVQSKSKFEARSTGAGQFEFAGLPAGDYVLEALVPGFKKLQEMVTLSAGQSVQRNITLQIGSVRETLTVTPNEIPQITDSSRGQQSSSQAERTPCGGGVIRPPKRVRDVRPQYPRNLRDTGIEGRVVMEARIGKDGFLKELRAVEQLHPDLANAAIEAVRQWQWDPAMLNCVPVEIPVMVTINFKVQ